MNYRLLGRSGLRVSELCLGTMTFGKEWGWGAAKDESMRIFQSYVDAGGNFIDTANRYTEGTSERFVGEFVSPNRDQFVLATKYTLYDQKGSPNTAGNHRKNMTRSLEASLRRLHTNYVDVLWVHAWDFLTPAEEVMRGLDDLVRSGKVLYVGISDTPAWIVSQANTIAELRGWTPFVALQIQYSLAERTPERDLLPMANALGLSVTPWGILGSGVLTAKFGRDKKATEPTRLTPASPKLNDRNLQLAETVRRVAADIGRTPSQVAINWVRQRGLSFIPILGARTLEQLQDNLGALAFQLTSDQLNTLDEASRIDLGFPHDFLRTDSIRELVYGGTYDQIVSDRKP